MKHKYLFTAALLSALCITSPATAAPDMKEGFWEITSTMNMPGMPMAMPAVSFSQCLTKEDMVPQKAEPDQNCKITKQKTSGNTVTWSMKCTGEAPMESTGKITYSGNSFQGSMEMTINNPGMGPMHMTQKMSGKRLGPCN